MSSKIKDFSTEDSKILPNLTFLSLKLRISDNVSDDFASPFSSSVSLISRGYYSLNHFTLVVVHHWTTPLPYSTASFKDSRSTKQIRYPRGCYLTFFLSASINCYYWTQTTTQNIWFCNNRENEISSLLSTLISTPKRLLNLNKKSTGEVTDYKRNRVVDSICHYYKKEKKNHWIVSSFSYEY